MIDKSRFKINDISLLSFCPLTLKDETINRYVPFTNILDSFDNNEQTYIDNYLYYFPYVLKSILFNSFELNKSILTYEDYFFNVCHGYNLKNNLKLPTSMFSKYWSAFIVEVNKIFDLQKDSFLGIEVFPIFHTKSKLVNCDSVNIPIQLEVLLTNYYAEENNHNVIVIPSFKHKNLISNQLVINMLTLNPKEKLSVLELYLDSPSISFTTIECNDYLLKTITNYKNNYYIDIKNIQFSKCFYCPIKDSCTTTDKFKKLDTITTLDRFKINRIKYKIKE